MKSTNPPVINVSVLVFCYRDLQKTLTLRTTMVNNLLQMYIFK